jgi:ubiquitin-protein ligase
MVKMAGPKAASIISASRRLQYDLKELTSNPIPNIDARPIGDDLFNWTFTMFAPDGYWAGIPFHGHMKFKHTYPAHPPEVVLKTSLEHPNVFSQTERHETEYSGFICLDMIRVSKQTEPTEYVQGPALWHMAECTHSAHHTNKRQQQQYR